MCVSLCSCISVHDTDTDTQAGWAQLNSISLTSGRLRHLCDDLSDALPLLLQEEVQKLMDRVGAFSQEQMKDRKSGIIVFQVAKDNHYEGTFHIWERYETISDFNRHLSTPEVMGFMEGVSSWLLCNSDLVKTHVQQQLVASRDTSDSYFTSFCM